ncbi:hypothetical protein CEXT_307881 [Caerostris extrusa]|uniref:Uncharacterized protein n=1 Tax=Caerostris extrusa TaxID=172846 RepID=A0AAV4XN78_CAEEX|nr:hypothetical protein CEXT_307881 [Caerostris extrusa]
MLRNPKSLSYASDKVTKPSRANVLSILWSRKFNTRNRLCRGKVINRREVNDLSRDHHTRFTSIVSKNIEFTIGHEYRISPLARER